MSDRLTGLFICFQCKEINEIPDYIPADADKDTRIGYLAETHIRRHPSVEDRIITDWASLGSVPTKNWEQADYRKQIVEKIMESHGRTGFEKSFYDTVDTFRGDALACWKRHNRPAYKDNTSPKCADYLDKSKELKPDTAVERKAAGLPKYDDVKIRPAYLCQYCPYHQTVVQEVRQ
jgi:hypothetical protein